MKSIKYLFTLLVACLAFQSQAQNPSDIVCAVIAPDIIIPMPLEIAETEGFEIVDCDENNIIVDVNDPIDCDCDWSTEELVCVNVVGTSDVFTVHACELECGYFVLTPECVVIECSEVIFGCTDSSAENYDEAATANDGSCQYDWNVDCDCDWETEEFVCIAFEGTDEIFTVHACELECYGEEFFFEGIVIVDCGDLVYGCTDLNAENYDETATVNDGSCEYDPEELVCVDFGWGEIVQMPLSDLASIFAEYDIVDCEDVVYGCTDPQAENYNDTATVNDGSCEYDWNAEECDCDWETEEFVCIAFEGTDEVFTVHACELECYGEEFFLEGIVIVDCGDLVYGCTDLNAVNFDENATANDGSCEYEGNGDCDCDWDTDNFVCVDFGGDDTILVHACELECFGNEFFGDYEIIECDTETEETTSEGGFIGGGQFGQENYINLADLYIELYLYPNPVEEEGLILLNVESKMNTTAFIQVTNSIGQTVLSESKTLQSGSNQYQLDVSGFEYGVYMTTVFTNEGASITERFIKK